jgi:hypothetical protein
LAADISATASNGCLRFQAAKADEHVLLEADIVGRQREVAGTGPLLLVEIPDRLR